ncbi:hypothetical protein IEI92_18445 [Microbispora bryophytorum]|uniref:Uncharacterized protein n=1 Tax=Microbispora bryophytorum TaxID=1460882 RepID=A0A8H9H8T0_9ACTN|nr:hypothetical protein [Microbispora bryophytorum]MBD3138226.1 hypothetical protein [Microbispora bryophytorum]TQS03983.1 hypothetical protein FLX07_22560 [Microbispora bryophytorum]GGO25424.1 hypothetical protein GCM10011574_56870 [Microbispora bryophytorum]
MRSQHKCDTALLVICPDRSTARWCERTIHLGPGGAITPLAIDPGRIPLITDPDQARASPELAVLSAVAHPAEADDEQDGQASGGDVDFLPSLKGGDSNPHGLGFLLHSRPPVREDSR